MESQRSSYNLNGYYLLSIFLIGFQITNQRVFYIPLFYDLRISSSFLNYIREVYKTHADWLYETQWFRHNSEHR